MTVPGLGGLLRAELEEQDGFYVEDSGFDGRADVVLFEVAPTRQVAALELDVAEDVFVEVGRTLRSEGNNPRWISNRMWRPHRVERALSVWAQLVRPLRRAMTFRAVIRVLEEGAFLRSGLRREFEAAIGRDRPRWRLGDPAQVEVWGVEYRRGRFVAGLRLSDRNMRQRGGRLVERKGALRPAVAAAMVRLADPPRGRLLDPCCGSGTILREACKRGWDTTGSDIDPDAVEVARANLGDAEVRVADVHALWLPDGAVQAVVSNLPFGRQYGVEGSMDVWMRLTLAELARVTEVGSRVVLLAPQLPAKVRPRGLVLKEQRSLRLLGMPSALWVLDRVSEESGHRFRPDGKGL